MADDLRVRVQREASRAVALAQQKASLVQRLQVRRVAYESPSCAVRRMPCAVQNQTEFTEQFLSRIETTGPDSRFDRYFLPTAAEENLAARSERPKISPPAKDNVLAERRGDYRSAEAAAIGQSAEMQHQLRVAEINAAGLTEQNEGG